MGSSLAMKTQSLSRVAYHTLLLHKVSSHRSSEMSLSVSSADSKTEIIQYLWWAETQKQLLVDLFVFKQLVAPSRLRFSLSRLHTVSSQVTLYTTGAKGRWSRTWAHQPLTKASNYDFPLALRLTSSHRTVIRWEGDSRGHNVGSPITLSVSSWLYHKGPVTRKLKGGRHDLVPGSSPHSYLRPAQRSQEDSPTESVPK